MLSNFRFKKNPPYLLTSDYAHKLNDEFPKVTHEVETPYLFLGEDNTLILKKGYACDGPSGPVMDTNTFMRGAFVHDALYQLIRLKHLEKDTCRILADRELYRVCREDGMVWIRATWVYYGVRVFGNPYAVDRRKRK